jgi:hypothetical protein
MIHKKCDIEGCYQPRYARGWCIYHYKLYFLLPKQNLKPKKTYQIKARTDDRAKDERLYLRKRTDFIQAQMRKDPQGRIFCVFCGKEIKGKIDLHHGIGRDNDLLLDEKFWFLSHHTCHMDYDSKSWKDLPWWTVYISNILKTGIHELIVMESKKMDK